MQTHKSSAVQLLARSRNLPLRSPVTFARENNSKEKILHISSLSFALRRTHDEPKTRYTHDTGNNWLHKLTGLMRVDANTSRIRAVVTLNHCAGSVGSIKDLADEFNLPLLPFSAFMFMSSACNLDLISPDFKPLLSVIYLLCRLSAPRSNMILNFNRRTTSQVYLLILVLALSHDDYHPRPIPSYNMTN